MKFWNGQAGTNAFGMIKAAEKLGFTAKGEKGMTLEAQVITGSKKILFWALEKMNLRD